MGFYLRKSFRAGPVRFNLSKSGLGLSGGVKGARVGTGPRGRYVHGGRHGLYYRKYQSSGGGSKKRSAKAAEDVGGGTLLLALIAIGVGIWFFLWLLDHPWILGAGIVTAVGIPVVRIISIPSACKSCWSCGIIKLSPLSYSQAIQL